VSRYVDEHRGRFGVEPICRTLDVSASAYHHRATGARSARALGDERLLDRIERLHGANYHCYGYRRTWLALKREGVDAGRDRVKRLMRANGIQGAKRRGKPWRTTIPDATAARRPDLVGRDFSAPAPDRLWVADFTYLRCWEGLVFFAFVIDVYSRRIVGWQLAGPMRTALVLDALRMALSRRRHGADVELVHHSDAGAQGGCNRSSQRSIERSCDGRDEKAAVGSGWATGDAVTGTSAGRAAGASPAVLDGDRSRSVQRGRGGRGGRVGRGWRPVVSGGWRDAVGHSRRSVGAVSVVRRARGDRDPSCRRLWSAGDRASTGPRAVDDLAGAASQCRDPQRRARVPGQHRAVAC